MEKGIFSFTVKELWGGAQVIVNNSQGERQWDAICHNYSYGHEEGLLEIMGTIVREDCYEVEGFLTAEEILKRI
jgi:hypothetical protein